MTERMGVRLPIMLIPDGTTVEFAGFDCTVHHVELDHVRLDFPDDQAIFVPCDQLFMVPCDTLEELRQVVEAAEVSP